MGLSKVMRALLKGQLQKERWEIQVLCNIICVICSLLNVMFEKILFGDLAWNGKLGCHLSPEMCILITSADFTAKLLIFYMVFRVSAFSAIWLWEEPAILIISLLGCKEELVNVIGVCLLFLEACFRLLSSWIQLCRKWYLIRTFHAVYSQRGWNSAI